jgi:hypothetical protein
MDVYDTVDAYTNDVNPVTPINSLIGKKTPHAFFPNYNCHGYAKFKVD